MNSDEAILHALALIGGIGAGLMLALLILLGIILYEIQGFRRDVNRWRRNL